MVKGGGGGKARVKSYVLIAGGSLLAVLRKKTTFKRVRPMGRSFKLN